MTRITLSPKLEASIREGVLKVYCALDKEAMLLSVFDWIDTLPHHPQELKVAKTKIGHIIYSDLGISSYYHCRPWLGVPSELV